MFPNLTAMADRAARQLFTGISGMPRRTPKGIAALLKPSAKPSSSTVHDSYYVSSRPSLLKRQLAVGELLTIGDFPALGDLHAPWSTIIAGLINKNIPTKPSLEPNLHSPSKCALRWLYPDPDGEIIIRLTVHHTQPLRLDGLYLKRRKQNGEKESLIFHNLQASEYDVFYPGLRAALIDLASRKLGN